MNELNKLRIRGVLMLTMLAWASTASLLLLSLLFDYQNELVPVALSAAINVVPTYYALRERYDAAAGVAFGIMAAVHPALLIYMLQGHPWQMEGHMFFFVGLASLTLVCDWRPIAVAVGLTAVHHLLLSYIAPEWVFIGSGDLLRVMVHALAVSMVLGVLGPMTVHMGRLFVEQSEARAASDVSAVEAEKSATSAKQALETARLALEKFETEREKRLEIERRGMAHARRDELLALAGAFEGSIAKVVQSVGAAAEQLERAASNMHHFAHTTGEQSAEAAREAQNASHSAMRVSAGVTDLSRSILSIAATADQQAKLGVAARGASQTGEEVIRALSEQAANIETFVGLIQGVASQTNMLALNATIEAARAGDAGRGFGVVAAEVKALASQAHDATGQINQIVSGISTGAAQADDAIGQVSRAMAELEQAASKMRSTVGDQSSVATLIEQSAVDSAAGATQIAQRIGEVARAAGEAVQFSDEIQASATGLTKVAQGLKSATDEFLSQLRAA
ncbi:MAG: methyl-accepting chemotaxis protein [Pseudomonadota bacterium]|nr:methyl-accepting chemotaxis protein [Pseudomonadota bacterium]